ncbi:hypothetical protein JY651_16645 [Pyxidicoccus parkwayensis]|uniref:Uncharacterized protein n=1 Tax=Pyxidicoccus parkwayensis TaxID=2813578 RepID=A0ABX7P7J5_9BACT|nr:hypothetical protein [Pyxidicoccus parkwaysis]QSQ26455.1 hypothetical protein JY651_16645 [Pyxidicoccus parkwaysis]
MSPPIAPALAASEAPASARVQGLWLFSPRVDVNLLLLPTLLMLACVWLADFTGEGAQGFSQAIGRWTSQYVFLNGTHVILTFLLVGTRRELLHTTPSQSRLLVGGSAAVFALTFGLLWYASEHAPLLALLLAAGTHVLAMHHTLSQVKGLWSLHMLRGRAGGAPAPSEAERTLLRQFVPLALLLMMVRTLALPVTGMPGARPMIDIGQAESGSLPHVLSWALLAVWAVFAVRLVLALHGAPGQGGPRKLYVLTHTAVVAVYLAWPLWGSILSAGIHGLEYFFLTGRMLQPTAREPMARLRGPRVWAAMLAVMAPIILVGVANSPFVTLVDGVTRGAATAFLLRQQPWWSLGVIATNAVVLAHYFADAFLYRFRIPRVREVTLPRLGLG